MGDLDVDTSARLVDTVLDAQGDFVAAVDAFEDGSFAEASALAGWIRGQLVAHVAYGARAVARITVAALGGQRGALPRRVPASAPPTWSGALTRTPGELRDENRAGVSMLATTWRELGVGEWDSTAGQRPVPRRHARPSSSPTCCRCE